MNELDFRAREIVLDRIKKGMLGPGSDTWGLPEKEEIISDYPLIRYFTGILFPKKGIVNSQNDSDSSEIESETSDEDPEIIPEQGVDDPNANLEKKNLTKVEDLKVSHNSFFPNNMALSICVNSSVTDLHVEFSFGLYIQPNYMNKKIKISKLGFDHFLTTRYPIHYRSLIN